MPVPQNQLQSVCFPQRHVYEVHSLVTELQARWTRP